MTVQSLLPSALSHADAQRRRGRYSPKIRLPGRCCPGNDPSANTSSLCHRPPDGMGPPRQGDQAAACGLQAGSQHFTESGDFLLVHGRQGLSSARRPDDGVQYIFKVNEGAFHLNRCALDASQACGSQEIPQHIQAGGPDNRRRRSGPADGGQCFIHDLIGEATILHVPWHRRPLFHPGATTRTISAKAFASLDTKKITNGVTARSNA